MDGSKSTTSLKKYQLVEKLCSKSTRAYRSLLYHCTILHSFVISGDINLSFGIYSSLLTAFKLFCEVLELLQFYQQFYYQINNQLFLLFYELLFLKRFLLYLLQIYQHYQEVFGYNYSLNFYKFVKINVLKTSLYCDIQLAVFYCIIFLSIFFFFLFNRFSLFFKSFSQRRIGKFSWFYQYTLYRR